MSFVLKNNVKLNYRIEIKPKSLLKIYFCINYNMIKKIKDIL